MENKMKQEEPTTVHAANGIFTEDQIRKAIEKERIMILPYSVHLFDFIYFLLYDEIHEGGPRYISGPQKVTAIDSRGVWITGYIGHPNGADDLIPWNEIGQTAFFSKENAERTLIRR